MVGPPLKIAAHCNWSPQTVRDVLHKWEKHGLEGLWDKPGRGGKPKYTEEDIVFLEECLKKEPRTYNSLQLAQKLESEAPKGAASLTPNSTESRQIKTGTQKKGVIWKRALNLS
jgi:hypothetical protein